MTHRKHFLIPVKRHEIELGKPLPWAVYDADRNLLLNRGVIVSTTHQVEVLNEKGLFRENIQRLPNRPLTDGAPDRPDDADGEVLSGDESKDALKLMPGDSLHLQPMIEGQSDRYTVRVIGMMRGRSVLVTAPMIEGKLIFVREAQPFLVRAFSGRNVYAFKSKVLKAQHSPFPYLHLAYPDSVHVVRIRKAMRAPAQIIVAINGNDAASVIGAGRLVDISVGGARMHVARNMRFSHDAVNIAFKVLLDDHEEYVSTHAAIRSTAEEDDEQGKPVLAVGLQFDALVPQQRLAIMNLVYQHMLKETL
jgi:c-di-GMP-binding flagellar brake protein YcgR